jgi:hypothetical protein
MTTTRTSHTDCTHPATKAARALCRKMRAAQESSARLQARALVDSYYDGSGDIEEIMGGLHRLGVGAVKGYYDGTLDIEEVMAEALRATA